MSKAARIIAGLLLSIGLVAVLLLGPAVTGRGKAMAYSVTRVKFTVKTSSHNTSAAPPGGRVIKLDLFKSALGLPYRGWALPPPGWPGR